MIDRWGPLDDGYATSDAQLNRDSARAFQGSERARRHDHEASLHDRLAAETVGWLYFAFLHAAEAHRAAARLERGALREQT